MDPTVVPVVTVELRLVVAAVLVGEVVTIPISVGGVTAVMRVELEGTGGGGTASGCI